jgi:hypothetical protein
MSSSDFCQPVAWGLPGCVLVPRRVRQALATLPLASVVRGSSLKTVADLERYWQITSQPLTEGQLNALVDLLRRSPLPEHDVLIPAGADLAELLRVWPLRTRTKNGLLRFRNGLQGADGGGVVTVGDFLSLPHLGLKSLMELACVAESAFGSPAVFPNSSTAGTLPPPSGAPASPPPAGLGRPGPPTSSPIAAALRPILAAAAEFFGATTVADVLELDLDELIADLGLHDESADGALTVELDDEWFTDRVVRRVAIRIGSLKEIEAAVLEHRLFAEAPLTLGELGDMCGVTRERVRQVESRLSGQLQDLAGSDLKVASAVIARRLGHATTTDSLDTSVDGVFRPPFDVDPEAGSRAVQLLRAMLRAGLDYEFVGEIGLDGRARDLASRLRAVEGDDCELVEESALEALAPAAQWGTHWDALLSYAGFIRLGSRLAKRDSKRARIKAFLLDTRMPATAEQIAAGTGLEVDRLSATLSTMGSVGRATKDTWALIDDLDDVYEGIPAEIAQRIEEDGGATSLDRLLAEIPAKFGVSPASVKTYAGTPQFVVRDGYVSLADASSLRLRHLDDVVHGRTSEGDPYWEFKVESRYLDGYSLANVPGEFAAYLGCEPNGAIRVDVDDPPHCRPISVNWRLASVTGASVGFVADPVSALGAGVGDIVRLVASERGPVRFERVTEDHAGEQDTTASSLLERMKQRRTVL